MSKWMVYTKKANFKEISQKFNIDQVLARIIRNRDVCLDDDIDNYLYGDIDRMHSPYMLKDAERAADIIINKIDKGCPIRIIGDYDIDGVCSTVILMKGLRSAGARVDYMVPDRIMDGYGINESLVDKALRDNIDTIVTCDNGIAAIDQIAYAKSKGLTVVVTDHHDVPYTEKDKERIYMQSEADAIVNPKQEACPYPFKMLCGAVVAYKLICIIYDKLSLSEEELAEYRQLAAIATIGDIMDLKGENRLLVKYGLRTLKDTVNTGLRSLIAECGIDIENISAYHIGFVIGPCLNASGRLDSASKAVELLLETDTDNAVKMAQQLRRLNEERKTMTEQQTKLAIKQVENMGDKAGKVLVVYLTECNESIAGIIAGRVKEKYYKPTIVITNAADGAKGSGRSIAGYHMFEELTRCRHLLTKFGGHPMAAGLSLEVDSIDKLRDELNANCTLTESQLEPETWIDVPMPVGYVTMKLINELEKLEPFGKGNEKPVFADRNLLVRGAYKLGSAGNVLKLDLESSDGAIVQGIMFRVTDDNQPKRGDMISIVYYPAINEYKGKRSVQFVIQDWKPVQ